MLGLLLVLGLTSCQKGPMATKTLEVDAILPLSGPLSPAGKAFAEGLQEGLEIFSSDTTRIKLFLLDNGSRSDSTARLLLQRRHSIVVAGIGTAAIDLPPRSQGISLWIGQEGEPPAGWTSLPALPAQQADSLLAWCRTAPRPLAILFGATAQWAPLVQERLEPKLDSLILIPHDGGELIWNREATRLLVSKPASVLLWHGPDQARSLLAREDLDSLWKSAKVLGPDGSGSAQVWGPNWEPSPEPGKHELQEWKNLGKQAARRLGPNSGSFLPAIPLSIRVPSP